MKPLHKIFILCYSALFFSQISAQTITSTTTGGNWNSASTWVGSAIPTSSNDVIINGPVTINVNATVQNFSVNSGCLLEDDGGYWRYLSIEGNLTNSGTIRHKSGSPYNLNITVKNNVTLNSNSINRDFILAFNSNQNKTIYAPGVLGCKIDILGAGGVIAASNLEFDSNGWIVLESDEIFNMGSYKLKVHERTTNIFSSSGSGRIISNGELEINGLFQCNLDGNFTLTGSSPMQISNDITVYGNFTIGSGKIIEHDGGYWRYVTVNGDIINHGTIRNKPAAGYILTFYAYKNVVNEGTIRDVTLCYRSNQQDQTISGSSPYSCRIELYGTGDVSAASNIRLDSLGYFVLTAGDSLIMGNYKLTIDERSSNITESSGDGRIHSNSQLEINGLFRCNLDGNFTLTGTSPMRLAGDLTVYGNLVVGAGKTLEHDGGYWRYLTVIGDLINHGTLRNKPGAAYNMNVYVYSGVINNGSMQNIILRYKSNLQNQTIAGSAPFGCKIEIDGTGELYAASNIRLDSLGYFELDTEDSVIMGSYKLTTDDRVINPTIGSGRIISEGELEINGLFCCNLDGNFSLTGSTPMRVSGSMTIYGNVTVASGKIIEHDNGYWRYLTVIGDIINNGTIRNKPDAAYNLTIYSHKNFINNGLITDVPIYINGSNTKNITGNYFNTNITFRAPNAFLIGDLKCKSLSADDPFTIKGSASVLSLSYINGWSRIKNYGVLSCKLKVDNSIWGYDFARAMIWFSSQPGIDSLTIESIGSQVPETFSGALKNYWRIIPHPQNAEVNFTTLRFRYVDEEMGNNTESELELFHSTDDAKTWKQISNSVNTARYDNYIQFSNVPAYGYYLLSSNPDPVSVRTNICLSIIGRDRIRIGGAPNRYTISYFNNSDVTTGEVLMRVAGQQGVFIKSVEPSVPAGAPKLNIPLDSISYDGKNDTIYLFVSPMAPRESRSFDVIFTADNTTLYKTGDTQILPLIGAVLWWGAAAVTTAYVTDVTMNVSENIWQPVGCRSVSEALKDVLYESWQQTNKDWFCFEKPAKAIAEAAGEEILKRGAGVAIPGKNIVEGAGRSMKGMERYVKGEFNVVTDCDGNKKNPEGDVSEQELRLTKVTSWDPNEKSGPKGTGEKNFVTSAGRISYRIFFENKKEAQAPAWKILIVDTLAAELNPETVIFETKSHEGDLYNWQIEKQFNSSSGRNDILRWYIEGIELPPNITPPEGEGFVSFSVEAGNQLPSGASIRNSATITFDINAPIRTNVWENTLDFTAPVTTLNSLPSEIENNKIVISWSVNDGVNGSGVSTTAVYGNRNDEGYRVMGTSVSDSCTIDVTNGTYSFYALSKDSAGNVEVQYNNIISTLITDVEKDILIPDEYIIYQNYPNPFNPSTKVKFGLPVESNVRIEIFDIIGQRVEKILEQPQSPGFHEILWNASSYSSGIYLIRIEAKSIDGKRSFRNTKKVLLLK